MECWEWFFYSLFWQNFRYSRIFGGYSKVTTSFYDLLMFVTPTTSGITIILNNNNKDKYKWDLSCNPVDNYLFKVNNRNIRTRCEICSTVRIKAPEWRHWCLSVVFVINFGIVLVSLLLTLNMFHDYSSVSSSTLNMKLPAGNIPVFLPSRKIKFSCLQHTFQKVNLLKICKEFTGKQP